jgi:hypothetical protein
LPRRISAPLSRISASRFERWSWRTTTVHIDFKGHFTGTFGKTKGQGQAIDFVATDLLKVTNGRITDNWHIEDNLTLLTQMGAAKVEQ